MQVWVPRADTVKVLVVKCRAMHPGTEYWGMGPWVWDRGGILVAFVLRVMGSRIAKCLLRPNLGNGFAVWLVALLIG